MTEKVKAYVDLLRLHFFFVWPVLFCSGLFLGFQFYSGFSVVLVVQAALIGFFGFEAGLVLNDIVDSSIDKKEGEAEKAAAPKKEPVKAPSSIAGMTGKTTAENSWTAARIDEMDETELTEVPPKIYDKYLRGELD